MSTKKILIILFLTVFSSTISFSNANDQVYHVAKGDVLWKIAEAYHLEWKDLAVYNSLSNPHLIFPNQQLTIPTIKKNSQVISKIEDYDELVKMALLNPEKLEQIKKEKKIINYEMISFLSDYYANHPSDKDVLVQIDRLIIDAERLWDDKKGGYWDGSPIFPEYMRTSMYTRALADTILSISEVDKTLVKTQWKQILRRNADWLMGDHIAQIKVLDSDPQRNQYKYVQKYNGTKYGLWKHSASGNQNVAKMSALFKAGTVFGEKKYKKAAQSEWDYIQKYQWKAINEKEGYITEHGHYDVGYSQVTLWILGDVYFESQDKEMQSKIIKIWNTVYGRVKDSKLTLDTSDSYIVTNKVATLSMPTIAFLNIEGLKIDEALILKILENRYDIELKDGLLDSGNASSYELTASDYYLRMGAIKKYLEK